MVARLIGPQRILLTRDDQGHRDYKVLFLVAHAPFDSPALILQAPGLPVFGDPFLLDLFSGEDEWAYARWDATVTPVYDKEPYTLSTVEVLYSTKPPGGGPPGGSPSNTSVPASPSSRFCRDVQFEDPLLEPMKVNGSFVKYTEELSVDRFGQPIVNSSWEMIRGPKVEFDKSKMQVVIEQNVADLELELVASMVDCVNFDVLWGINPRCIKLSNCSWERKYYGACYVYFTRRFEFDIDFNGFDRNIMDEGSMVLNGHWNRTTGHYVTDPIPTYAGANNPDPFNPSHFIRYKDRRDENSRTPLDGKGLPAQTLVGSYPANYYISMKDGNKGRPLSNKTWWRPVNYYSVPSPPTWSNTVEYNEGNLVIFGSGLGSTYIANMFNVNTSPGQSDYFWTYVTSPGPVNGGSYDQLNTYAAGDYVAAPFPSTGVGLRRVEAYNEADFLLLGIPSDLTSGF